MKKPPPSPKRRPSSADPAAIKKAELIKANKRIQAVGNSYLLVRKRLIY